MGAVVKRLRRSAGPDTVRPDSFPYPRARAGLARSQSSSARLSPKCVSQLAVTHILLEPSRHPSKVAPLLVKAGEWGVETPMQSNSVARFWRPGGMRACPAGLPVKAHALCA